MGVVIYLPRRRCNGCVFFDTPEDAAGMVGSWCLNWDEPIDNETVADECPDYEPEERQHDRGSADQFQR